MEVVRLDKTTFLPDDIVEGYSSLIWTERFIEAGEFELKTYDITNTLKLLPQWSLISLMDTREVMILESRLIEYDDDGVQTLKLSGSSLDSFMKHRILLPTVHGEPWPTLKQYKPVEINMLLLWNHLVNATQQDVTRANKLLDPNTSIPNTVVTDGTSRVITPVEWWLEQGNAYDFLVKKLTDTNIGVECIRPVPNSGVATVVSFDTSTTSSRGDISRSYPSDIPQLRFHVRYGLDRSATTVNREPVIFHYESGHLDAMSYLYSVKEFKDVCYVSTSQGVVEVWPKTGGAPPTISGLDRRVHFLDGGDISQALRDAYATTWQSSATQKGQSELQKRAIVRVFDGQISEFSPYKYKQHYFLGDIVTLRAQFGFQENMRVSEYIRTFDNEGDRGYPGLSSLWFNLGDS